METMPEWLSPFLRYALWNQWELLNILCGLPPLASEVVVSKQQKLMEAEWRRDADRHVTDAIRIGDLVVEPTIANQRLLEKITPHVEDSVALDKIKLAVLAARLYSNEYHVRVDVAIRWAVSRKTLFPRCPLSLELLAAATPALTEDRGSTVDAGVDATSNVFLRRTNKRWDMQFAGHAKTGLPDRKGFQLIRHLLEAPNEFVDATALRGLDPVSVSYGSPTIDAKATRAYQDRLHAIGEEREEAEGDSARQLALDDEADKIEQALLASQGLRGPRRIGDDAEKARKATLQNFTTALKTIAKALPDLHEHLSKRIQTGQSYRYAPDADIRWKTRA